MRRGAGREGIQKIQEMQQKLQEGLAEKKVEASAGGGMVTAVANGQQQIVGLTIEKDVVIPVVSKADLVSMIGKIHPTQKINARGYCIQK